MLASAGVYLDKARGAEAGEKNGRDPREAQMWRKAAERRMKEAEYRGNLGFPPEDTENETELDESILSCIWLLSTACCPTARAWHRGTIVQGNCYTD